MASAFTNAAKRSGSLIPLTAVVGATVLYAFYNNQSMMSSGDNRAEKRFAPVSQPWHAKNESDATNKDRVARYRYKYVDQKTGQLVEAPSAVSSEVHPIKKLPENLSGYYPSDRYDGDN